MASGMISGNGPRSPHGPSSSNHYLRILPLGIVVLLLLATSASGQTSTSPSKLKKHQTNIDWIMIPSQSSNNSSDLSIASGSSSSPSLRECQMQAPLKCGFVHIPAETILFSKGVLEFSTFTGLCSNDCTRYLTSSPSCKKHKAFQRTMLSICRGYSCAADVKAACGHSIIDDRVDHAVACTTCCSDAMKARTCQDAEQVLPAFQAYRDSFGPGGSQCLQYDCYVALEENCAGFDWGRSTLPGLSLCRPECYNAAASLCLKAAVVVVSNEGKVKSQWKDVVNDSSAWGPLAGHCKTVDTGRLAPGAVASPRRASTSSSCNDTSIRMPDESYPAPPPPSDMGEPSRDDDPPGGQEDMNDMPAPEDPGALTPVATTPAVDPANGSLANPAEAGGGIRDVDELQEQGPVSTDGTAVPTDGNGDESLSMPVETALPFGSGPDAQGRGDDNSAVREAPSGNAIAVGNGGMGSPSSEIQEPQPSTSDGRGHNAPVTDTSSAISVEVNTTSGTQGTGIRSVETPPPGSGGSNVGGIVAGIVGGVAIFGGAVGAVLLVRKQQEKEPAALAASPPIDQTESHAMVEVEDEASTSAV